VLTYKSVWDGSEKLDWEKEKAKRTFFKSGHQGLYALHIDVKMATTLGMKSLIKKALKSTVIKAYMNLPLLLVPVLTYNMPQSNWDGIDHAHAQHEIAQKAMAKHFSMKICALDHPLVSMDNATLRTMLMAMKAPDGKPLLLSVDHS